MTIEMNNIERLRINHPADVSRLRREVLAAARAVGMSEQEQEAMRIVAS